MSIKCVDKVALSYFYLPCVLGHRERNIKNTENEKNPPEDTMVKNWSLPLAIDENIFITNNFTVIENEGKVLNRVFLVTITTTKERRNVSKK